MTRHALERDDPTLMQDEVLAFLARRWTSTGAAEGGPVRDHAAASLYEYFASEHYKIAVRELRTSVVAKCCGGRLAVKWKASGVEQADTAGTWRPFEDGMLVRFEAYHDRSEALEAVGLSEQDAHADS